MEIKIVSFKGIKDITFNKSVQIIENAGWGKTRCFEAFMWLVGNYNPVKLSDLFDYKNDSIHDTVEVFANFCDFSLRKKLSKNLKNGEIGNVNYSINEEIVSASDFKKFCTEKKLQFTNLKFFDEIDKTTDKFAIIFPIAKSMVNEVFKDFDLNASLMLKSKYIAQRNKLVELMKSNESKANMTQHEVPVMSEELEFMENKYQAIKCNVNSELIKSINEKYNKEIKEKEAKIILKNSEIIKAENDLQGNKIKIKAYRELKFDEKIIDVLELGKNVDELKKDLENSVIYENLESLRSHISKNIESFPEIYDNSIKITEFRNAEFNIEDSDIDGYCSVIGAFCEKAGTKLTEVAIKCFNESKINEIDLIKNKNKIIIETIFNETREKFEQKKRSLIHAEEKLAESLRYNSKIKDREFEFYKNRDYNIELLSISINEAECLIKRLREDLELIENLEIKLPKLPTIIEVTKELHDAHAEFESIQKEITKIVGANDRIAAEVNSAKDEIKKAYIQNTNLSNEINLLTDSIKDYLIEIQRVLTINTKQGDIELKLFRETDSGTYINDFEIMCNGERLSNSQNIVALIYILSLIFKFYGIKLPVMFDNAECCNDSFITANKLGIDMIEFNHFKNFKNN